MKKSKKFLSMLCVLCMVMAFAVPAFAASTVAPRSTEDSHFGFNVSFLNFNAVTDSRSKSGTTAVYVNVTKSGEAWVRTQVQGSNNSSSGFTNYTELGDRTVVDYVFIPLNAARLIHSGVNEGGKSYARLAFKARNVWGDTIAGDWSPDSAGSYTFATNVEP